MKVIDHYNGRSIIRGNLIWRIHCSVMDEINICITFQRLIRDTLPMREVENILKNNEITNFISYITGDDKTMTIVLKTNHVPNKSKIDLVNKLDNEIVSLIRPYWEKYAPKEIVSEELRKL